MGKPTGFMEYERVGNEAVSPLERIKNFDEFHTPMPEEERKKQGARCMECGVPFCQSGMMIGGMASGCPLNNLIPEWNDLLYTGNLEQALNRLLKTNNFPEFTSRVCPSPCEAACTCGLNCNPISIKENENFISIPLTLVVVFLLFAFWIFVPLMIVGLFCGFRYGFRGPLFKSDDVFNNAMNKASAATETIKEEFKDKK